VCFGDCSLLVRSSGEISELSKGKKHFIGNNGKKINRST
jgi:hypothetical protein